MTTNDLHDETTDEELAVYEKMRKKVRKTFGELQDRINTETISEAINRAIHEIKEAGEYSKEAINNASTAFKKDIVSSSKYIRPRVDEVAEGTRKQFGNLLDKGGAFWHDIVRDAEHVQEYSRDKGGAFLSNIFRGLSEWSKEVSTILDTSLSYRTGETSHGGEFKCTGCGGKIHLKQPGRIPPCPKCSKTEFRRT